MAQALRIKLTGWPGRGSALLRAGIAGQQSLQEAAGQIAPELRARAIAESPVSAQPRDDAGRYGRRTGIRFRDSWITRVQPSYQGGATLTLSNTSPQAPFVLNDTRPHEIWAAHLLGTRSASVRRSIRPGEQYPLRSAAMGLGYLKFRGRGGGFTFRHMVKHPGTKANRVGERVDAAMQPRYQEILHERALELVARLQSVFSS